MIGRSCDYQGKDEKWDATRAHGLDRMCAAIEVKRKGGGVRERKEQLVSQNA
jgi:hypothetical protein